MPSDDDGLAPTEGPGFQSSWYASSRWICLTFKHDLNSVYIIAQYTHAKYMTLIDFVCAKWLWMILLQCEALPQTQTIPIQVLSYRVLSGPDWENGFSDSLRNFEDGKGFGFTTRLLRRMQGDFLGHVRARALGRTSWSDFLLQNASRRWTDFMFLESIWPGSYHTVETARGGSWLKCAFLPICTLIYFEHVENGIDSLAGLTFAILGEGQRISFLSNSLGKPAVFALFVSFRTVEAIRSLCMYFIVINCHWWWLIIDW